MNLISCEKCGVVINKDRIEITDDQYDLLDLFMESVSNEEARKYWHWNCDNNKLDFYIPCPACKTNIFLSSGETTGS